MGVERLEVAAVCPRLLWGVISCVFACIAPAVTPGAEPLPRSVLFLDHNDPGEAFGQGMSAAFRTTISTSGREHVAIYAESLDLIRHSGSRYEETLKTYLREKYRDIPIGVIVGPGTAALTFMLHARAEIWPEVPAIFVANAAAAAEAGTLPGVSGLVRRQPLQASVNAAQALIPGLKSVALVGDVPRQDYQRARFKEQIAALADVDIIDLTGLRMAELLQRVAALPDRTVIYFTTLTFDGDKPTYVSRDALVAIAQVAKRPIIVDLETHVGYGSVGGLVADPGAIGRALAGLALRILDGESASNIPVVTGDFVRPIFDARQLQRWGIRESNLPEGSEIRFRQPTAWEQYHTQILIACAAFLVQTALIGWLIYEHRRRRNAEVLARRSMGELANMNRIATAGELSASIAHEVKQPLTAMVAHVSAGLRWLGAATPDHERAHGAFQKALKAGNQATEVIDSIRALFKKEEANETQLDLNALISSVLYLLTDELQAHDIVLRTNLDPLLSPVDGHRGELQQVILNLARNAADAMSKVSDRPRVLTIKSENQLPNEILISVGDNGTGACRTADLSFCQAVGCKRGSAPVV